MESIVLSLAYNFAADKPRERSIPGLGIKNDEKPIFMLGDCAADARFGRLLSLQKKGTAGTRAGNNPECAHMRARLPATSLSTDLQLVWNRPRPGNHVRGALIDLCPPSG